MPLELRTHQGGVAVVNAWVQIVEELDFSIYQKKTSPLKAEN